MPIESREGEQCLKKSAAVYGMEKETGKRGVFGRLLRFWRITFGLTQEELAWEVGVSFRHINFLETGRSQPRRDMVLRLAEALVLSLRDINNLLAAAGLMPIRQERFLAGKEADFLQQSLVRTLRNLDPHPSIVMDPYTNIRMINKGFLRLLRDFIRPEAIKDALIGYHLLFSEEGLRPHMLHWEEMACLWLMALQQEVILNEDPVAQGILDEVLVYPGIPGGWQRRAVELGKGKLSFSNSFTLRHGYQLPLRQRDGKVRRYYTMMTTLGSAASIKPRILFYTLYPEDGSPYVSAEELALDQTLKHPLLPYV